jgi:K(+)-stimulated pyrophosphate-energized sodium pump
MYPLSLNNSVVIALAVAAVGFLVALWLGRWVKSRPSSNERIEEVSGLIRRGSYTFLKKEYRILAIFAGVVALLIALFLPSPIWTSGNPRLNITVAVAYLLGNIFSGFSGYIGIFVSTIANKKTAEAAVEGIKPSFLAGFRGGSVMGLAVVGATLLGVASIFALTNNATVLFGFGFGASSMALFAKAGGGVFTKSADIAADLTGKVELGIPEDDPRNPAVIADNVGDNVGDVAGMGADLFDSNVAALVAALVLGGLLGAETGDSRLTTMVFVYAAIGLLASIVGIAFARMKDGQSPTTALNKGNYLSTALFAVLTAASTYVFGFEWRIWGATIGGLVVGTLIGIATDYFTNDERKPVRDAAQAAESGAALTILGGMASGLMSVFPALLGIAGSALFAYKIAEPLGGTTYAMFGIAMAAVGMLSINGIIIANDAYGPIADNARGLAEMGELGDEVIDRLDRLDSAGNTVKAITKGFAIGAAGMTVIALLGAFMSEANEKALALGMEAITGFDLMNPLVFFGLLVGASAPAVFSSKLMRGTTRNAERLVAEIRRQFREIIGLKEGLKGVKPDYDACLEISTVGALKELVVAGVIVIAMTLSVGFIGGVRASGGFIVGNIVTGLLLALFMSNSGGLWDNAKKYIEAGNHGGKGSDAHKAAVVGDTVGDPFKDTAGPSINTLVTVVSLVSSLSAGLFLQFSLF